MALIVWNFVFQNLCIAAAYRPVEELLEEEKVIEFNNFFHVVHCASFNTGACAH
jgi:hypothetical protein